ncbi:substrate-binding domain-containing protein, partial [Myxococcota bacterium]|nr:substrate-binding domain-containing protein [Myxococcota bacterium]
MVLLVLVYALQLALGAGAASAESAPAASQPLRVFAAASLTEVVEALAQEFVAGAAGAAGPGAKAPRSVLTSFGASSDLARQIRDGAPADVFVSASPEWVEFLREAGMLAGEPVLVARNSLVCV